MGKPGTPEDLQRGAIAVGAASRRSRSASSDPDALLARGTGGCSESAARARRDRATPAECPGRWGRVSRPAPFQPARRHTSNACSAAGHEPDGPAHPRDRFAEGCIDRLPGPPGQSLAQLHLGQRGRGHKIRGMRLELLPIQAGGIAIVSPSKGLIGPAGGGRGRAGPPKARPAGGSGSRRRSGDLRTGPRCGPPMEPMSFQDCSIIRRGWRPMRSQGGAVLQSGLPGPRRSRKA